MAFKQWMHVVEANTQVGVISGWKVIPGMKVMYNLEVAQDHTFVVGMGQWVVHNCTFQTFLAENQGKFNSVEEAKAAFNTINRASAKEQFWAADGSIFRNDNGDLPVNGQTYKEWTVHFGDTVIGDHTQRGGLRVLIGLWWYRLSRQKWTNFKIKLISLEN